MNPNLFKSAEFSRRRYHNFATVLIVPLLLLVLFLFAFSFLAKKEVTVQAMGEVTPTQVIASIQSTSDNTILTNQLTDNSLVEKGQLLLAYSGTMEASQKEALTKQLETYKRQLTGLETLKTSLNQGANLFEGEDEFGYAATFANYQSQLADIEKGIDKTNSDISSQIAASGQASAAISSQMAGIEQKIAAYEEIKAAVQNQQTGISASNPFQAEFRAYQSQAGTNEAAKDQYLAQLESNLSSLSDSLASLRVQQASSSATPSYDTSLSSKSEVLRTQFLQSASQQTTEVQAKVTELESQLSQADSLLSATQIRAPETGLLHVLPDSLGKTILPKGTEIAQIYPPLTESQEVLIRYYVPSSQVALLREGQEARLRLEKLGSQPLTLVGKIESIAQAATTTKQGNLFQVTAKAQLGQLPAGFKYGLEGRVTSIVAQKTFFDYYKDKILGEG